MEKEIKNQETKKFYKYLGNRLKYFRILNKYSQEYIAKKIGVTFQQVQKYESGENHIPIQRLIIFTKVFHLSFEELLGEVFEPVKTKYSNDFLKALCFAQKLKDYKICDMIEKLS